MATEFLKQDGLTPTAEGARVLEWMKAQLSEAEKDKAPDRLNKLPGMVRHFYVNVVKLKALTEAAWLRDYPNAATSALEILVEADAENAREVEQTERNGKIDEQLKKLTEELQAARAEIKQLQEAKPNAAAGQPEDKAAGAADDKKKKKDDAAGGGEEGK